MEQKQDKSLQLNIIYGIIGQIISLAINLVSKNALRSNLGIEYLGLQSIYGNFCDIFSFAFSGIGTAMLFQLYGAMAKGDNEQVASVYSYFNKLCKIISMGVLAVGLLASSILLLFVNTSIPALEVVTGYTLYLLSVIILNRYIFKQYFIIASLRRYLVTMILSVTDLLALLVELFFLYILKSYIGFLLCIIVKNIVINLWLHITLRKRYPYVLKRAKRLPATEEKSILKNVGDLLVYRIGSVLVNNTDGILTSSLISTAMAGYYSNYQFVVMGISSLTGSFFEAIVAKIGHIISTQSKKNQFISFLNVSFVNLVISGFTCTCLYWLVQDFLVLWMGPDAPLSVMIVGIVTFNHYLDTTHKTIASYRISAGIFNKVKKMVFARGMTNLILSILFGKLYGLFGILIATALSDIITMQWYEPYLMYKYFKKTIGYEVFFQSAGVISTLLSILITGTLVQDITVSSLGGFFIKAAICGSISLLCYGVFFIISRPVYKFIIERNLTLE